MLSLGLDIPSVATRGRYPPWLLSAAGAPYPDIDIDFVNNRAWSRTSGGLVTPASLFSMTRASSETYTDAAGLLSAVGNNALATGNAGLQVFETRANVVLWSNDLTNAAWTKSNATAALDQTGPDGVANSASSLLATAGNATALQAITLGSSARFQTAYVKRLVGSGEVDMTMDNGATWTAVTVTAGWTRVSIPTQTLANPTVGFRLVTNGDKIAVFLVQNENGAFATPGIPTTTVAVTRANDSVAFAGPLLALMVAATASVVTRSGPSPNTAAGIRLIGDNAVGDGLIVGATTTVNGLYNGTNLLVGSNGDYSAAAQKIATAWAPSARSIVGSGGSVVTDTNSQVSRTGYFLGSAFGNSFFLNGNVQRLSLWPVKLVDSTLQSLTT